MSKQKITPFLWFDDRAEEAMNHYVSIFKNSRIISFGVSWQIVPSVLGRLMGDPDRDKAGRVVQAMLKMTKFDIAGLQLAYDGR